MAGEQPGAWHKRLLKFSRTSFPGSCLGTHLLLEAPASQTRIGGRITFRSPQPNFLFAREAECGLPCGKMTRALSKGVLFLPVLALVVLWQEERAWSGPVVIKAQQAKAKGLLVQQLEDGSFFGKTSQMNATVALGSRSDALRVGFNQNVGGSMGAALVEGLKHLRIRHGGNLMGGTVEIAFQDKWIPKDGPSGALPCTLMIHSLITGDPVRGAIAFTGDMNADGKVRPVGGVDAKILGAARAKCRIVAIPAGNREDAYDLCVLKGVKPIRQVQIVSVDTFEKALEIAGDKRAAKIESALATFEEVQTVLARPGGARFLRHPKVLEKLKAVGRAMPNHESAKILYLAGTGRTPKTLSARGSLLAIESQIPGLFRALANDDFGDFGLDARKGLPAIAGNIRMLRRKLHRDAQPYANAILEFAKVFEDNRRTLGSETLSETKFRALSKELKLKTLAVRDVRADLIRKYAASTDLVD